MAGLCFRGKSFWEHKLSRKERNLPKHSFSAGAQIQSKEVIGFSLLCVDCQVPAAQPRPPEGSQTWDTRQWETVLGLPSHSLAAKDF